MVTGGKRLMIKGKPNLGVEMLETDGSAYMETQTPY